MLFAQITPKMLQNYNIYIFRHGETEFNVQDRLQGYTDSPLTKKGIQQARMLDQFVATKHIRQWYISPMQRVKNTFRLLHTQNSMQPVVTEALQEVCYGAWEGKAKSTLAEDPLWKERLKNKFTFLHPGTYKGIPGQCYADLRPRLKQLFSSLFQTHQSVGVIAHYGVIQTILKLYGNVPENEFPRVPNSTYLVLNSEKRTLTMHDYDEYS